MIRFDQFFTYHRGSFTKALEYIFPEIRAVHSEPIHPSICTGIVYEMLKNAIILSVNYGRIISRQWYHYFVSLTITCQ